jgi:hypothetical protein
MTPMNPMTSTGTSHWHVQRDAWRRIDRERDMLTLAFMLRVTKVKASLQLTLTIHVNFSRYRNSWSPSSVGSRECCKSIKRKHFWGRNQETYCDVLRISISTDLLKDSCCHYYYYYYYFTLLYFFEKRIFNYRSSSSALQPRVAVSLLNNLLPS